MVSIHHIAGGILIGAISVIWVGCAGPSRLDLPHAGRTLVYEPGTPDFDMEAVVTIRDGKAGIDLYLGIPYASLIFVREGDGFIATYETIYRLRDRRGRRIIMEETGADTIRVADYERTQSFDSFVVRHRLSASMGSYIAEVLLIDTRAEKEALRRQAVHIGNFEQDGTTLSQVQLQGRREGEPFEPVVSLFVPRDIDSLRAVVEVGSVGTDNTVGISMRLLHFLSDTTTALPPYWFSPSRGALSYRGIDYHEADTLQQTRRLVENVDEPVEIFFSFTSLTEGVYRVEIDLEPGTIGDNRPHGVTGVTREFLVATPYFPLVGTLDQMIDALVFIAEKREMESLRSGSTPAEKKERFDAFWGAIISNRELAANLIKLYYGRVEEANRLFTSHKEGWKTDRGMVYIVFGAPVYVENDIDREVWHYSMFGSADQVDRFVFERSEGTNREDPFTNYVLQRRPDFEQAWTRALDRWRDGRVR